MEVILMKKEEVRGKGYGMMANKYIFIQKYTYYSCEAQKYVSLKNELFFVVSFFFLSI